MKSYSKKYYKKLIEKFMAGETSLEEEQMLYHLFTEKELSEELSQYKNFFMALSSLSASKNDTIEGDEAVKKKDGESKHVNSQWFSIVVVAAIVIVSLASVLWLFEKRSIDVYDGSYMIVDGRVIDDMSDISSNIKQTLAWSETVEREIGRMQTVSDVEQEIIDVVGDSNLRNRIDSLLKK